MTTDEASALTAVPAGLLEVLEAVRRSGAHMMERAHVLVLARRMGYCQTVRWVEEHPDEHARGISHGSEVVGNES